MRIYIYIYIYIYVSFYATFRGLNLPKNNTFVNLLQSFLLILYLFMKKLLPGSIFRKLCLKIIDK